MAIIDTSLEKESQDRYLTYALSVVSGRALPDVRDGLKPVQRRILYAMFERLGLKPSGSHKKSATVVGEVLGRYHPHGDIPCYEAMVRMAQEFSLRYPLVDGQGNFGSIDGDSAAAYRYTEAKLREIALDVIGEIDQETVSFRDNFDSTTTEPTVFPSRVPNLLINGATGIAVGMATSIPPHNLKDTTKALLTLLDDPEATDAKLAATIKGPDFPSGCLILNTKKELEEIYRTGKGAVRMRGEWVTEELKRGKKALVVTSLPYTVNKAQLVEKIANFIIEKKLPQLVDVRDESTENVRIVLELANGADPEAAMAYLYKYTPLDTAFQVNLTALVPTERGPLRPELMSLRSCLQHFLRFREEVVRKKLEFEKKKLLERIHILEGLVAIYDDLDTALKIVRKSDGRTDAAEKLRERFHLTEIQAFAVVDMRIYQLSRTNIEEIRAELEEKSNRVAEIDKILAKRAKILDIVRREIEELGEKFGDKRLCKLTNENAEIEFRAEDYVVNEDVYAIVTADGWIKRIRQSNEPTSTRLREGDSIAGAHALSTLDSVVFFTNLGNLFLLKVSEFPSSSGYGDPVQKFLKFRDGEKIIDSFGLKATTQAEIVPAPKMIKNGDKVALISEKGMGFIIELTTIEEVKRNGRRVMKLRDDDRLAAVVAPRTKLYCFTGNGSGLAVNCKELPERDAAAVGIIVMGVRDDDTIVAAVSAGDNPTLTLHFASGVKKEIPGKEVTSGHRGLKGTKVISSGELKSVTIEK